MTAALTTGSIFAGRYRVVRKIATGGMGAVYEVIHLETERRRALKVMLPHVLQSKELRERFQREAKVAAYVESDFIVDVFDAGFDEETEMPFLVMELLRGEELGKRLQRFGRLAPIEVVTYLHQAALALDKTHRASIVHRDLKPENLFLTDRDDGLPRIKVLDFGIAKIVAEGATAGGTQSIGTPLYMAPEQFNPRLRLSGAADIYALTMMAYTLLVGAPYWAEEAGAGNLIALAMTAVHGPREPASARAAARGIPLPPAFDAWFARGAAVDPAQRFSTATEAIAALADALGVPSPGRAMMTSVAMMEAPAWNTSAPARTPVGAAPSTSSLSRPEPVTTPMQVTPAPATTTAPKPSPRGPNATIIAAIMTSSLSVILGIVYVILRMRGAPDAASGAEARQASAIVSAAEAPPAPTMKPAEEPRVEVSATAEAPAASATTSASAASAAKASAATPAPAPSPAGEKKPAAPVKTTKKKYSME